MNGQEKKELGRRIKARREQKGILQEKLAQMLGMNRTNIANYETGRVVPPSTVLKQLAEALDTTADYLLGRTDDPEPEGSEFDEDVRVIARQAQLLDAERRKQIENFVKFIMQTEMGDEKKK